MVFKTGASARYKNKFTINCTKQGVKKALGREMINK